MYIEKNKTKKQQLTTHHCTCTWRQAKRSKTPFICFYVCCRGGVAALQYPLRWAAVVINWHGLSVNPGADPPWLAAASATPSPIRGGEVGRGGEEGRSDKVAQSPSSPRNPRKRDRGPFKSPALRGDGGGGTDRTCWIAPSLAGAQCASFSLNPGVGCAWQANEHLALPFFRRSG